jgi:hypothetical protein
MPSFPTRADVDAVIPASRKPYIDAQVALSTREYRVSRVLSNDRVAVYGDYAPRVIARALRGLLSPDLQPPLEEPLKDVIAAMVSEFDQPHLKGSSEEKVLSVAGNLGAAVLALSAAVDHGFQYVSGERQPTYQLDTLGGPVVLSDGAKAILEREHYAHLDGFDPLASGGQNG